jgi:uncharacterized protein YeaO (DUF488 family)
MSVEIKRVYEARSDADGYRVLVDRLWPRGLTKERAAVDLWLKEIAPTTDLRQWWDHDATRMDEFARRYHAELADNPAVAELRNVIGEHPTTTLVYGAKDPVINQARVLMEYLAAN